MGTQTTKAADNMQVLITGGTGFIGRYLVPKLAERGDFLFLLVRKSGLWKAQVLLREWSLESRVVLLLGDITQRDFGLSQEEIRSLGRSITHIYHLAADYGPQTSHEVIRTSIVDATHHLLDLSRKFPKLERVFFVSTVHVCGEMEGVIYEDSLPAPKAFHSFYERCKNLAEALVRQAGDLPTTIFRPSMVIGHSRNGALKRSGGPYRLIRAVERGWFKFYPGPCTAPLPLVPVDFVAEAMVAISQKPESRGRTFHLCDPSPRPARFFIEELSRLLGRPSPKVVVPPGIAKKVPFALWKRGVEILNQEAWFDTTNTAHALAGSGLTCPPLETYLPHIVRAYREGRR